jgi:CO/xanthine dehydrogenase Mo-binding subunit
MGYVGSRMRRLEDPRLLAGVGHFADDEERPGQLWMPWSARRSHMPFWVRST